jgi:anti-sigma28 factor (negative regulator of flagellin synthesis)
MRPQMQPPMMQQQMLPAPPQTYEQQALAQPPQQVQPQQVQPQQVQPQQVQPQQVQAQPQQPAQPRPPQQETDKSVIAQIEEAIRAKFDTKQVAAALIAYFQDPSIQEALEEAEGDFEVVLQKRLGSWSKEAPSNEEYLKTLFAEVEKQIEAAGLKGDDSDDGDEGDDE